MSLEYRLTLAGAVAVEEVATQAFPDPADRPTPLPDTDVLDADLEQRYGFTVNVLAETDSVYEAPAETDGGLWAWEPAASVDLSLTMTRDTDRYPAALRHAIGAFARVLGSGTEDAAIMLNGNTLLLTRVNGTITKHDQDWWQRNDWANDLIPS